MTRLVTFSTGGSPRPGALRDGRVLDLAAAGLPVGEDGDLGAIALGGDGLLTKAAEAVSAWAGADFAAEDIHFHAPILHPSKVIGIGLNYIDHCREAGLDVPEEPVVFTKHSTTVNGPYDDVTWYEDVCRDIDYEAELGVVIGKQAYRVGESDALDYVMGYAVVNDVSARDLQFLGPRQWDLGKSLDTFCPWGPAIVTRDEIPDPQTLGLRLFVNGDKKQESNTSNMIFGVANLIAYLSRAFTLLPGDLIATGTPFGVGLGLKPPVYMKDGDECVTEIDGIGALRNRMRVLR